MIGGTREVKTCSVCGHVLDSLELDVRAWDCPNCRAHHDRDVNAAKSVLAEGLRARSADEQAEARLGRSGKRKPAWNQGSHGPANQEPGRASAEEKSPAFRQGDLLNLSLLFGRRKAEAIPQKERAFHPYIWKAGDFQALE